MLGKPSRVNWEIVVVFCDLRGYTAFTETAEPEEVLKFLREYHVSQGDEKILESHRRDIARWGRSLASSKGRSTSSRATGSWCSSLADMGKRRDRHDL